MPESGGEVVAFNDRGNILVLGAGLYSHGDGVLAQKGDPAPGRAGVTYTEFPRGLLAPDGGVLFRATTNELPFNHTGIWRSGAGGIELLLYEGEDALGAPVESTIVAFGSMAFNANGGVYFVARRRRKTKLM